MDDARQLPLFKRLPVPRGAQPWRRSPPPRRARAGDWRWVQLELRLRGGGGRELQRVLIEVVDRIGLAETIELCRGWGGRTLVVPQRVGAAHPLALTLGLRLARKLCEAFGGRTLQLPRERAALIERRNIAIYKACIEEGRSRESVGLEYGLTRQGVDAVIRRERDLSTSATRREEASS